MRAMLAPHSRAKSLVTASTRWRLALFCVVGLWASACGRSCSCIEGEKTFETLDGKVKVELVRKTKWEGGGRGPPMPSSQFYLRVAASPEFEVPVGCDHVDMAEDDAGTLVGWRCRGERVWNLIRIVGGRHYEDCAVHEVGKDDKPEFTLAKPLADAAARIALCSGSFASDRNQDEIFASTVEVVRSAHGAVGVGRFFADTADFSDQYRRDPWETAVLAVSAPERAEVEKATCPSLRDEGASTERYARVARMCPFDDGTARVALGRLRVELGASTLESARVDGARWAIVIALANRPKDAGALACAMHGKGTSDLEAEVYAMIALGGDACASLSPIECSSVALCDGGTCTRTSLDGDLRAWLARSRTASKPSALRENPTIPPHDTARTAAAVLGGVVPSDVVARRLRATYALDAGSGAWCNDELLALGAPCACGFMPSGAADFCRLSPDAGWAAFDTCELRVDDRARTIGSPRRLCSRLGESCGTCCAPFTCRNVDGAALCVRLASDGGAPTLAD